MKRRRTYVTWTTDVDVDIDLAELVEDLTDDELANVGLMRLPEGVVPPASGGHGDHGLCSPGLDEHLIAVRACRSLYAS